VLINTLLMFKRLHVTRKLLVLLKLTLSILTIEHHSNLHNLTRSHHSSSSYQKHFLRQNFWSRLFVVPLKTTIEGIMLRPRIALLTFPTLKMWVGMRLCSQFRAGRQAGVWVEHITIRVQVCGCKNGSLRAQGTNERLVNKDLVDARVLIDDVAAQVRHSHSVSRPGGQAAWRTRLRKRRVPIFALITAVIIDSGDSTEGCQSSLDMSTRCASDNNVQCAVAQRR